MDKYKHIGALKYALIVSGYWEPKYIESRSLRCFYLMFRISIFAYFILFVMSQYAEMIITYTGEVNLSEVSQIGSLAFLYTIMAVKFSLLRGHVITSLIEDAALVQDEVHKSSDCVLNKIQEKYVKMALFLNWYYVFGCLVVTFLVYYNFYCLYISEWNYELLGPKPVPFPSYKPFNISKHYLAAVLSCVAAGQIACHMYIVNLSLSAGIVIFFIAQIKILQYHSKNFKKFVVLNTENFSNLSNEKKYMLCVGILSKQHKALVRHVNNFNNVLQYITLLEFIVLSLQLSFEVFSTIVNISKGQLEIYQPILTTLNVSQVFIFYFLAEQMTDEGLKIGQAVYQNDWYSTSPKVQKQMLLFIQGVQKPMCLTLGPFARLSASKAVAIMKASYSYTMLLMKSNN